MRSSETEVITVGWCRSDHVLEGEDWLYGVARKILANRGRGSVRRPRLVLALSVWEGLSAREIADLLRIRPDAVRARLSRARNRLREELSPQHGYT